MNIIEKIKGWFNRLPKWVRILLSFITSCILSVLTELGEGAINHLKRSIIEQSKKDISGKDKIDNVVKGFRDYFGEITITTSLLNLVIEVLIQELKKQRLI